MSSNCASLASGSGGGVPLLQSSSPQVFFYHIHLLCSPTHLSNIQVALQDECSAHHLLVAGDHHGDGLGLLRHGARARHGAARVQVLFQDE